MALLTISSALYGWKFYCWREKEMEIIWAETGNNTVMVRKYKPKSPKCFLGKDDIYISTCTIKSILTDVMTDKERPSNDKMNQSHSEWLVDCWLNNPSNAKLPTTMFRLEMNAMIQYDSPWAIIQWWRHHGRATVGYKWQAAVGIHAQFVNVFSKVNLIGARPGHGGRQLTCL